MPSDFPFIHSPASPLTSMLANLAAQGNAARLNAYGPLAQALASIGQDVGRGFTRQGQYQFRREEREAGQEFERGMAQKRRLHERTMAFVANRRAREAQKEGHDLTREQMLMSAATQQLNNIYDAMNRVHDRIQSAQSVGMEPSAEDVAFLKHLQEQRDVVLSRYPSIDLGHYSPPGRATAPPDKTEPPAIPNPADNNMADIQKQLSDLEKEPPPATLADKLRRRQKESGLRATKEEAWRGLVNEMTQEIRPVVEETYPAGLASRVDADSAVLAELMLKEGERLTKVSPGKTWLFNTRVPPGGWFSGDTAQTPAGYGLQRIAEAIAEGEVDEDRLVRIGMEYQIRKMSSSRLEEFGYEAHDPKFDRLTPHQIRAYVRLLAGNPEYQKLGVSIRPKTPVAHHQPEFWMDHAQAQMWTPGTGANVLGDFLLPMWKRELSSMFTPPALERPMRNPLATPERLGLSSTASYRVPPPIPLSDTEQDRARSLLQQYAPMAPTMAGPGEGSPVDIANEAQMTPEQMRRWRSFQGAVKQSLGIHDTRRLAEAFWQRERQMGHAGVPR